MRQSKPDINIILITIDALRADHLGSYGYPRKTSPYIDKLANKEVMFTQAISAGVWTGESVPSILTGVYPSVHQMYDWNTSRKAFIKTLPQHLGIKGFTSALFSNLKVISMVDIMDGFDLTYITDQDETNSHELTLKTIDWIKKNEDRSFFVYLHYFGAHSPYRAPEPYRSKFLTDRLRIKKEIPIDRNNENEAEKGKIPFIVVEHNIQDTGYYITQYDGAISYEDAQIGFLIDNLGQLGLLENTVVILTADHGEEFGEHEIYFAHKGCYEGNIRVPLIIKFPESFPKKKIITQQVSLIDITPTILEMAKLNIPDYVQGKSLLSLFKKDKLDLHPYVYTSRFPQKTIRSENWKLIFNGSTYELYNIAKDSQEQYNLVNDEKEIFMEMKAVMEMYDRGSISSEERRARHLTEKQKEILRSLGYF